MKSFTPHPDEEGTERFGEDVGKQESVSASHRIPMKRELKDGDRPLQCVAAGKASHRIPMKRELKGIPDLTLGKHRDR